MFGGVAGMGRCPVCVARGKNLLRKGSFPLALSLFQTFSGSRVRGGRSGSVWGCRWNGWMSWVCCEREKPFEERFFPSRALLFPNLFGQPRARRGDWGSVEGWVKKKTFSWVARYCKEEKVRKKIPASNYSPALCCAVPSSRGLLSIVFGMGT